MPVLKIKGENMAKISFDILYGLAYTIEIEHASAFDDAPPYFASMKDLAAYLFNKINEGTISGHRDIFYHLNWGNGCVTSNCPGTNTKPGSRGVVHTRGLDVTWKIKRRDSGSGYFYHPKFNLSDGVSNTFSGSITAEESSFASETSCSIGLVTETSLLKATDCGNSWSGGTHMLRFYDVNGNGDSTKILTRCLYDWNDVFNLSSECLGNWDQSPILAFMHHIYCSDGSPGQVFWTNQNPKDPNPTWSDPEINLCTFISCPSCNYPTMQITDPTIPWEDPAKSNLSNYYDLGGSFKWGCSAVSMSLDDFNNLPAHDKLVLSNGRWTDNS